MTQTDLPACAAQTGTVLLLSCPSLWFTQPPFRSSARGDKQEGTKTIRANLPASASSPLARLVLEKGAAPQERRWHVAVHHLYRLDSSWHPLHPSPHTCLGLRATTRTCTGCGSPPAWGSHRGPRSLGSPWPLPQYLPRGTDRSIRGRSPAPRPRSCPPARSPPPSPAPLGSPQAPAEQRSPEQRARGSLGWVFPNLASTVAEVGKR